MKKKIKNFHTDLVRVNIMINNLIIINFRARIIIMVGMEAELYQKILIIIVIEEEIKMLTLAMKKEVINYTFNYD